MHRELFEYLKSPELVVRVQEYFGVEYLQKLVEDHHHSSKKEITRVVKINNKFWYYLFLFGTFLGDELFYVTFIPFWFWNVDGAVGRRIVMVWSSLMYIGQTMKDVIGWDRPGLPVKKLQEKWGDEFGMPSTHAIVSFSIPFSVVIYTMNRYIYPVPVGILIATVWCTVVCLSRVYLGMHSVLDIIAGLLLTVILMFPLIPLVDYLDFVCITSRYSPVFILTFAIFIIAFYPNPGKWTPTRGDTTLTVSVCAGIEIGAWLNYQLGNLSAPTAPPPYEIIYPSYLMFVLLMVRTIFGLCCILATQAMGKSMAYAFVCAILGKDKNELRNSANSLMNKDKIIVELSYKFFASFMVGFNLQYLLPNVFKLLKIGRPDFYTEI